MSDKTEAPKRIWLQSTDDFPCNDYDYEWVTWTDHRTHQDDIEYIRADRHAALLEAAVSLHYWLFELLNQEIITPAHCYPEGSDVRDAIESAQLALDKWDRFCDGKTEEE